MLDLKGPYDAVNAADAKLKAQAEIIASLLAEGTDEATAQALALQDSLDTLQADYDRKLGLYQSMVKANAPSDVAKLFVPASPTTSEEEEKPKNVMKLAEFQNLTPSERMRFVKAGGTCED